MKSTDRCMISGLPGSGKSTLAAYFATRWMPNILIFDTIDQHRGFPDENRYVPQSGDMAEFENICKRFCDATDPLLKNGSGVLILEECEDYIGQGRMLPYYSYKVIRQGRNWGVGIIAVTQRIQEVEKKFVDRCQHLFLFSSGTFTYPYIRDLKLFMENPWNTMPKRLNIVDILARLEQYQFVHYDMERSEGAIRRLKL